jgi:hypothetical protein
MRIRAYRSIHTALSTYIVIHHRWNTHAKIPRLHYIHHIIYTRLQHDTGHATHNGNDTVEIFLLRQSDISTDTGIVLMNGAKDRGLLRARGQQLDSVLFSQSDNRHITTNTWTVPKPFTASFPPHFTCFVCISSAMDDSWRNGKIWLPLK